MVADITLKSTQKETVRKIFKNFLEISSIATLMLLLNNNGRNNNSEKSIELCSIIANSIESQSLENVISGKVKIFNTKEYFNSSKE